jgi:putative transposase
MAKPLSMDLRERAVSRVESGQSVRAVAAQLGVSPSSVVKWSQRFRRTGSAAPGKMGGYRRPKIAGQWRAWLVDRIRSAEFTLRGLAGELADRGLKVDYHTVWTFVHREGLTYMSVVKTFGTIGGVIEWRIWRIGWERLCGLAAVKQASVLDGLSFDPFSFKQDGLTASEVDIGRGEIGDTLVVSQVIVVSDELADPGLEIAGQIVVLKQDAVLQGLMPSLDLALGLRMERGATDMIKALALEPFDEIGGDVT